MTSDDATTVSDERLIELFGSRRTDAEAFERAVDDKIDQRRRSSGTGISDIADHDQESKPFGSTPWRSRVAASFAPWVTLPGSTSGKTLAGILSLPVVVLAGSVMAFGSGARALGRRPSARDANGQLIGGMLAMAVYVLGIVLLFLGPFLLGARLATDAITVLLAVSMIAFVLQVRGLRSKPTFRSWSVAVAAAEVLFVVHLACFVWAPRFGLIALDSELGIEASVWVLIAGVCGVGLLDCLLNRRSPWWLLASVGVGLAMASSLLFRYPSHSDLPKLQQLVAEIAVDPDGFHEWGAIGSLAEVLSAAGAAVPQSAQVRQTVEATLDTAKGGHAPMWNAVAEAGWMPADGWRRLAMRRRESRLIESFSQFDTRPPSALFDEYVLRLVLNTERVSPSQLDQTAQWLERTWPEISRTDVEAIRLSGVLRWVRLAELMGRPDLVDSKTPEIHRVLRQHWVSEVDSGWNMSGGGFASQPSEFAISSEGATWQGVSLMARVGVPDGIDPVLLRARLRDDVADLAPSLKRMSHASLVRFERQIGLPKRGWLDRVIGERLLISTVLLVALCWVAVWLASRRMDRSAVQATEPAA